MVFGFVLSHGTERTLRWRYRIRPCWQAYRLWLRADCVDLSAAFAYHTLQSFLPALLLALALFSRMFGAGRILRLRLEDGLSQIVPEGAMPPLVDVVDRFSRQGLGAGILGALFLVLSAGNIYLTLQRGADRLWWNRPFDTQDFRFSLFLTRFFFLRLKAFVVVLVAGLFVVFDQFISAFRVVASSTLRDVLTDSLPLALGWLASISSLGDLLLSLFVGFLASWLTLWVLPSRPVPWMPLLPSALLISVGLTLLNLLLGNALLALGFRFQAYGVVGAVMLITLWIWLVGVLLYYGQCLAVVLARRGGGRQWRSALGGVVDAWQKG